MVLSLGCILPKQWKNLEFVPSKNTGITGTPAFLIRFIMEACHSISFIVFSGFALEETSPAGNRPRAPPLFRCSVAIFNPLKLLLNPGLSVNGFTGKNFSSRFGMYDSKKFVSIFISGLTAPIVFKRITPSIAPNG